MAFPVLQYFSKLSYKRHFKKKKKLLNTKSVFWLSLQLTYETTHPQKNWSRYNHTCLLVFTESTLFFIYILIKTEFSLQILKIYSNIKFHKIRPVEAECVPCGQTDMTKLTVAFCNFASASKETVVHINANHSYVTLPFLTLRPRQLLVTNNHPNIQQALILGLCHVDSTLLRTVVMKHRPWFSGTQSWSSSSSKLGRICSQLRP